MGTPKTLHTHRPVGQEVQVLMSGVVQVRHAMSQAPGALEPTVVGMVGRVACRSPPIEMKGSCRGRAATCSRGMARKGDGTHKEWSYDKRVMVGPRTNSARRASKHGIPTRREKGETVRGRTQGGTGAPRPSHIHPSRGRWRTSDTHASGQEHTHPSSCSPPPHPHTPLPPRQARPCPAPGPPRTAGRA